jgi:hypothetical protein
MAFSKMAQTSSSFLALPITKVTGRHEVFQRGEREREARDVQRGEMEFFFMFIIFTWIATVEPYI